MRIDLRDQVKFLAAIRLLQTFCAVVLSLIVSSTVYGQEPVEADDDDFFIQVTPDTLSAAKFKSTEGIPRPDERPRIQDMVVNVPGDWVSAGEVAIDSRTLPYLGGIGVLTGVLMATDKQTNGISRRMTENSEAVRSTSRTIVRLGDGKTHLAIAAGFALYGLAWDDSRALRTSSQTVEAILSCGIAVQVLKRITGRESPQVATSDRGVWRFFPNLRSYQQHQSRYYAFPSGHISTTMATVTVIAENYPEVSWIRPVGYSLVGLLGISLVNVGYHWYSDLPLGIAMGYLFGMVASHRNDSHFAFLGNDPYSGLRVLPDFTRERTGVEVAFVF